MTLIKFKLLMIIYKINRWRSVNTFKEELNSNPLSSSNPRSNRLHQIKAHRKKKKKLLIQKTRIKRKSNDNLKSPKNFILHEILIIFSRFIFNNIYFSVY